MSFCLAQGVLTQKLGPQLVLLHVPQGQYFELNSTGAIVLEALLAGSNEAAAAEQLSRRFEVDPLRAQSDVSALVKDLSDRALLVLK